MTTAYINIGSNTGDRGSTLEQAVAAIEERMGVKARRSPVVESEPWGYESANNYLNIGIAVEAEMEPCELLDTLLDVQHAIDPNPHRDSAGGYIDRRLDIDLIAVDEMVVDTPRLVLPHPRMHLRRFVLEPMEALAPQWRHPLTGLTSGEMLRGL